MDHLKDKFLEGARVLTTKTKKKNPYRIKMNGEFICLGKKNKSVWNGIGPAKNALNCHLKHHITQTILEDSDIEPEKLYTRYYYSTKDEERVWKEFLEWAEDTGFVEFVEVTNE